MPCGVPVREGPGIVLVDSNISTVHGVLVVPADVGLGSVVVAVCGILVDGGADIVSISREVHDSHQPPSIMPYVCHVPRLLVP